MREIMIWGNPKAAVALIGLHKGMLESAEEEGVTIKTLDEVQGEGGSS